MANVLQLVIPLAGILVSTGIAFGASFLRQKTKNEVALRAIFSVSSIVRAAVLEAQQTVVDNLKKANNGRLTDDEKAFTKENVMNAVKERLTSETVKELQGITADLEGYLSSLIESCVYANKNVIVGKS